MTRRSLGHLYRELWRLAEGSRRSLLFAFLLLLGSQLIRLGVPALSGYAINALQLNGLPGMREAGFWLALVFAATLASWALHGPGRLLERNVALLVRQRLSGEMLGKLLRLPLAWHEAQHSGATTHRVEQSSRALYDFAQTQFIYLQQAVGLAGPVIALWLIEPVVGAAALFGLLLISVSLTGFDRAMIRLALTENDAERRYASTLIDTIANITSVFALRQTRAVTALVQRRLLAIYQPLRRMILINEAKWCAVDVGSQALSCGLLALFAYLAARGIAQSAPVAATAGPTPTLPLGNVYMVWQYALQAGGVISGIAAHFQTFARQQADYAAGEPIRAAAPAHFAAVGTTAAAPWRSLKVRGLVFHHASARDAAPALDDLAFTLDRGKRYALIGGSGSGKSTLLRVLSGLYLPTGLQLVVDRDQTIADPTEAVQWLRGTATLIPQDAEVFEGSLAENLALCESVDGTPDPGRYAAALRQSCASDFVALNASGLEMQIAERGANWSGGQRQRVALARGILAAEGSGLVLLDEPTASLDPTTERRVYDNLFSGFAEACIVSSVHRLNLLERFDEVLLMDAGRLLDRGSVEELLQRSAVFRGLMAAQQLADDDAAIAPASPA